MSQTQHSFEGPLAVPAFSLLGFDDVTVLGWRDDTLTFRRDLKACGSEAQGQEEKELQSLPQPHRRPLVRQDRYMCGLMASLGTYRTLKI